MKVILVDDEPPGRLALRQQLAGLPDAEIVAECADGASAIQAIVQHAPDVLFLDVQLGTVSGLDVLERVGTDAVPAIVFVTAYDRYAVRAFEAHAVDYLLKPIDPDRFREAWGRAAERVALETDQPDKRIAALVGNDADHPLERFVVREGGRLSFVPVESVDWIEAAGNYVRLHAAGKEHLLRQTLAELSQRLRGRFVRVRRTALVNAGAIAALEPYGKGSYLVYLKNGTRLLSSRYAGRALRELLKP
ncbi:MAG: LytR/AlgR family response regulator transcription factor [Gemmatimonadales bacterium]